VQYQAPWEEALDLLTADVVWTDDLTCHAEAVATVEEENGGADDEEE